MKTPGLSRRTFLRRAGALGSLAPLAALVPHQVGRRTTAPLSLATRRQSSVALALQQLAPGATTLDERLVSQLVFNGLSRTQRNGNRYDQDKRDRELIEGRVTINNATLLKARYPNTKRHFAFEYYPWYRVNPWEHWGQYGRNPPIDAATTMMPLLGAYDSHDRVVIEQHARWIAAAGVGTVNLSWWGPGSWPDLAVHTIMDIMRAHDIHVAFHLEPYDNARGSRLAEDITYLIREYGDRRRWDNFLLLDRPGGQAGPVFKLFRSIVPPTFTDCLGRTTPVADYTPDVVWREELGIIRETFKRDFPVTVLADSLDLGRTMASTFDGIAIYDNFVTPDIWPGVAATFGTHNLISSFNINAGFDAIEPRGPQGPCYLPQPIAPPVGPVTWELQSERDRVAAANDGRMTATFDTTTALQASAQSANWRSGFFMVYINSFNEWHEGSALEPSKNWADLSAEERAVGYHNPNDGFRRMKTLQTKLAVFR